MKKKFIFLFSILIAVLLMVITSITAFAATKTVVIKSSEFEAEQGNVFSTIFSAETTDRVEAFESVFEFDSNVAEIVNNKVYTFGQSVSFENDGEEYVAYSYQNEDKPTFVFFKAVNEEANPDNTITIDNYSELGYVISTENFDDLFAAFKSKYGVITYLPEILINVVDDNVMISWIPNDTAIDGKEMFSLQFVAEENLAEGEYASWININDKYDSFAEYNDTPLELSFEFAPLSIYGYGDINFDHKVDTRDALRARQHYLRIEGKTLTGLRFKLGDVNFDGKVNTRDALNIQKYKIKLLDNIGNRYNVEFYDADGELCYTKSVLVGGNVINLPSVPTKTGYSDGVWSASATEYVKPVFTNIQAGIKVYAFYDSSSFTTEAMEYYKRILTEQYYTGGDVSQNISSDLTLRSTIKYQAGYYADIIWYSSSNYILNQTTGKFTKPVYPNELTLTAKIISYNADDMIENEDTVAFDYSVPGEFSTPSKDIVADFLKHYLTDTTDGKYRINYDVKLIAKVNNTVLPAEGTLYDNFEIRISWLQNIGGNLVPVNQVKRTTESQINDYVAVVSFNGKPLEDDGKIYFDDVEVTPIEQMEIRNYIINQIAASQGTLATNNRELWNNDTAYGTTVTWESGNTKIAYVENNVIKLKDDAITGSTLPLNARVSYAVDGGTEEFVLSYNLTVSCNNTIIKAPENMDPDLYKAIKSELEETLGYRGDLTSAALANVKFVNLDLSGYPDIASLRGLSYCTNLRTLNISGLHITDGTMNQIATLSYLEAFIARGCGLDNLSDGGTATLKNAVKLQLLDLTDNNFTSLDSVFAEGVKYGDLREVYLSDNKLTDINALQRAPIMSYLSLSGNGLTTEGTASLKNYTYLTYLSLANNKIDSVENITGLKYLRELRLQYNNLSDVRALRTLVNLECLYLGHNNISDVGFFTSLTALKVLYVNDNSISDISTLSTLKNLEAINVSNNKISSLSVLRNYAGTLTEIYAENNNLTDFGFINGANKLHILMLSGNNTELIQSNLNTWLSDLSEMEVLTLSGIRMNTLAFLENMSKLVRLDVASCGLSAFNGDESNIEYICGRYSTLKVLDISNNDMTGYETEILKLKDVSLLTVLFADNICDNLDAYQLTYSMPDLVYISFENCGITNLNWLFKYSSLKYVDLAGNNISSIDFDADISNASIKTLKELYLDTTVQCSFVDAYRKVDFNVEKLSLKGISVESVTKLPYLDNIKYLNLDSTGITSLTGEDDELQSYYSIERYSTVETLDLSNLEADISVVENMKSVNTLYAVGTTDSELFHEDNLHSLQRLYNKGVTCYLYDKDTVYEPVASKEGKEILDLLDDISCSIVVAADNVFSDNNPYIVDEINDFDISWTVSNSDNYEIKDNHLSVKSYTGLEDETLTVTAEITVYPDQAPVTRVFTIDTHILRAAPEYYSFDIENYSEQKTRGQQFNYFLDLVNAETDGFSTPVKPVEDSITYSYSAKSENGTVIPYSNVLSSISESYCIASDAPLGATVTINIVISHNNKSGEVMVDNPEAINATVTIASRTFNATFETNGGALTDSYNSVIANRDYIEDSLIFEGLTLSRPGYSFKGWYLDSDFTELFSATGENAKMPMQNITLYAKWEAVSYSIVFNANGGSVSQTSKTALSDVEIGTLPTPTRQYYTFNGWFTAASGGSQVTATSKFARTDDITLYAHWTLNSFVISFNANGGSVSQTTLRAYCGQALGTLPTPSRTGFTFNGWYTSASGGAAVTNSSTYTTANDFTVYAHWTCNSYTASWNGATNCSITVTRTSSPNAGAGTGTIYSDTIVYYGDVLSVSYSASTGYSIATKGGTSFTVTRNITSSDIYASASANSYTYNVVYKSSNGTALGSTTATYKYGTTNTISAPSKSGYNTPGSQSIAWDSTSAKTITFTYSPSGTSTASSTGKYNNNPQMWYYAEVRYQNRTANSVQVMVAWDVTVEKTGYNAYSQNMRSTINGTNYYSTAVAFNSWGAYASYDRQAYATTDWITVPLNTTNQVNISIPCYLYQNNANGTDMVSYGAGTASFTLTQTIPAY